MERKYDSHAPWCLELRELWPRPEDDAQSDTDRQTGIGEFLKGLENDLKINIEEAGYVEGSRKDCSIEGQNDTIEAGDETEFWKCRKEIYRIWRTTCDCAEAAATREQEVESVLKGLEEALNKPPQDNS